MLESSLGVLFLGVVITIFICVDSLVGDCRVISSDPKLLVDDFRVGDCLPCLNKLFLFYTYGAWAEYESISLKLGLSYEYLI